MPTSLQHAWFDPAGPIRHFEHGDSLQQNPNAPHVV